MNQAASLPRLRTHPNYDRLVALAAESHARGRDPFIATPRDIALARLYCHAFRRHVIGAFHATRRELEAVVDATADAGPAAAEISRATESLADLADRSMDLVEHDVRVLIASFHHYAVHVVRVVESLARACDLATGAGRASLGIIRDRFVAHMEAITAGNGLSLTRDDAAPAQGCFQVPNLGITIVPLVYGDHHSWNLAWLDGAKSDVPCHVHREGVEIHLGYGPLHGHTILGDVKAEVTEGYAMPIPPGTRHGYVNIGSRTHHVPFIFGSLTLGGWGVRPHRRRAEDADRAAEFAAEHDGMFTVHTWSRSCRHLAPHRPVVSGAKTTAAAPIQQGLFGSEASGPIKNVESTSRSLKLSTGMQSAGRMS